MEHLPEIITEYELLKSKKRFNSAQKIKANIIVEQYRNSKQILNIKKPMESFLANFVRFLAYFLNGESTYADTIGADGAALSDVKNYFDVTEGTAADIGTASTYGIYIGDVFNESGGVAKTVQDAAMATIVGAADYNLHRKFNNSGLTTSFAASATTVTMPTNDKIRIQRSFTYSDAVEDAYISEIGLMANASGATAETVLLARDIINNGASDSIPITNGDVIKLYYEISVSDSSGYKQNFLAYLSSKLKATTSLISLVDTSAASGAVDFSGGVTETFLAAAEGDDYGIILSKYLTKFPLVDSNTEDYAIPNKISSAAAGATTGIYYDTTTKIDNYYNSTASVFGVYRDFENLDSQSPVDIARVSLVFYQTNYYLISSADTNASVGYITIPPNETLRVKMYLSFPFSNSEE